jgi:hypothetical protein
MHRYAREALRLREVLSNRGMQEEDEPPEGRRIGHGRTRGEDRVGN